jgi:ABC-type transport system involved in multi-copper enzyme maturation permease subunit
MLLIFISILVSVGFGYLFFRIVRPKSKTGSKSIFYARTYLAWSLFVSTSFFMQPFAGYNRLGGVAGPSLETLTIWAIPSIPFALVAALVGFLYGKFR